MSQNSQVERFIVKWIESTDKAFCQLGLIKSVMHRVLPAYWRNSLPPRHLSGESGQEGRAAWCPQPGCSAASAWFAHRYSKCDPAHFGKHLQLTLQMLCRTWLSADWEWDLPAGGPLPTLPGLQLAPWTQYLPEYLAAKGLFFIYEALRAGHWFSSQSCVWRRCCVQRTPYSCLCLSPPAFC